MRNSYSIQPLRAWRLREGYTLADLSGLSGISRSMLSRVERGERRLSPAKKVTLARSVGVTVAALFTVDSPQEVPR